MTPKQAVSPEMKLREKHITIGATGLGCTILGVVLRAFSSNLSMQVVSRKEGITVHRENPTMASLCTEAGLALLLIGVALVFAAALVWMLKPHDTTETKVQLAAEP
jgi:uncharacterized membrane protein